MSCQHKETMNDLTAKLQLSATVEILSKMINSQYAAFYADADNLSEEEQITLAKACKLYKHFTGKKTFVGIETTVEEYLDTPVTLFI